MKPSRSPIKLFFFFSSRCWFGLVVLGRRLFVLINSEINIKQVHLHIRELARRRPSVSAQQNIYMRVSVRSHFVVWCVCAYVC